MLAFQIACDMKQFYNRHCDNMDQVLRAASLYDSRLRATFEKTCKNTDYWRDVEQMFYELADKHGIKVAGFFSHREKDETDHLIPNP